MKASKPAFNHVLILGIECAPPDRLDDELHKLIEFRLNPVIVLGSNNESALRQSSLMADLQIVFNPNEQNFLGALKAGLFFSKRPCFFLSYFERPNPLNALEGELRSVALRFHPLTANFSDAHVLGTPQLGWITSEGYKLLKSLPSDADLWQLPELRLKSFTSVG